MQLIKNQNIMNKLREKFENVEICIECQLLILKYDENMNTINSLEQITDDFSLKFFKWCNVNKYELPNEMSVEEKLQIFKEKYYE